MTKTGPRILAGLTAILSLTACTTPAPPALPAGPASSPAPAPVAPAATSTSPQVSPVAATAWITGSTTVRHSPAVPPVPVLTGVRHAGHPADGYDRIVFDIEGGLPGYSVSYVDEVRADPSDRPVSVPGRRYLLIVFTPVQAHRDSGAPTVTGVHRADLPMLKAFAVAGDYEGHVSIALGLGGAKGYRVGELPGRIFVDVAT